MKKIALFNHKGGVGKTTLTVNLADMFKDLGKRVLIVDADPQCNISSFYLNEAELDAILEEDEHNSSTLWGAVKPVVEGTGSFKRIEPLDLLLEGEAEKTDGCLDLLVGDVLLSNYEEELSSAWIDAYAGRPRGHNVMSAVSDLVRNLANDYKYDLVFYDVGPNVGALNRALILDCDYFITPVCADLFSLRALSSVGLVMQRWIREWQKIQDASNYARLSGKPKFLGYISSCPLGSNS